METRWMLIFYLLVPRWVETPVDNPGLVPLSAIVQLLNTPLPRPSPQHDHLSISAGFQNNPFLETKFVEKRLLQLVAGSNREQFLHTTQ
jgi:hypothetical protein